MSNAIRRGEDDELERASERKGWVGGWMEETGRQAEWWFGALAGPSPAECERPRQRKRGKRFVSALQRKGVARVSSS